MIEKRSKKAAVRLAVEMAIGGAEMGRAGAQGAPDLALIRFGPARGFDSGPPRRLPTFWRFCVEIVQILALYLVP
jgi:hypothetical protein